ncbi:MAG: NAD(P)-dependent glycerol-3-phosphate dehydrogenase [Coriobacteriales bacterium]|jgi:glycerol-3-phosphate dehydrogenase (NAD(P)+)|nr:NAD(P)-dependent glycerol-3-phosphate dehydrogenase [Coriobacteriales bacterium]
MRVSVIGAGSWGSALAQHLALSGNEVVLWARSAALVEQINARHENPAYLSDIVFSERIVATTDLVWALRDTQAVVLATPSAAVRTICQAMATSYPATVPLLLLSKGVENSSGTLLLDVIREELSRGSTVNATTGIVSSAPAVTDCNVNGDRGGLGNDTGSGLGSDIGSSLGSDTESIAAGATVDNPKSVAPLQLAVLSGPNHAEEVAKTMFSATVIASSNSDTARLFQQLLASDNFRVYTSSDTIGVQVCGAAKNVIAIATGVAVGRKFGDNATAMLMTRGLAEISRLVEARGGMSQTCMGLAGMGDLIATCTSVHSRNRSFGLALAKGTSIAEYEQHSHMVVEGALAAKSVTNLAQNLGVEMPICETMRGVIWEGLPLQETIPDLMKRSAKPEFY